MSKPILRLESMLASVDAQVVVNLAGKGRSSISKAIGYLRSTLASIDAHAIVNLLGKPGRVPRELITAAQQHACDYGCAVRYNACRDTLSYCLQVIAIPGYTARDYERSALFLPSRETLPCTSIKTLSRPAPSLLWVQHCTPSDLHSVTCTPAALLGHQAAPQGVARNFPARVRLALVSPVRLRPSAVAHRVGF